jgi:hypothetical protein
MWLSAPVLASLLLGRSGGRILGGGGGLAGLGFFVHGFQIGIQNFHVVVRAQFLDEIGRELGDFHPRQPVLDVRRRRGVINFLGRRLVEQLDDVVAKLRGDDVADRIGRQRKREL